MIMKRIHCEVGSDI